MFLPPAFGHMAEVEGEVAFLDLEGLAVMEVQKLVVAEVQKGLAVKEVQKLERTKIQTPVNKYLTNSNIISTQIAYLCLITSSYMAGQGLCSRQLLSTNALKF